MPNRPLSLADVPSATLLHMGDTSASRSKGRASREMPSINRKPEILGVTGIAQAKSSTPMWPRAILTVFALSIVAIIFGGLDALPSLTRVGITDYIVAIGASEPPAVPIEE